MLVFLVPTFAGAVDVTLDQQVVGAVDGVPHWLKRMQWGTVQELLYQSITGVEVIQAGDEFPLRYHAEVDVQATVSEDPAGQIRELYGSVGFAAFDLRLGYFRQTLGYTGPVELSSGSMSVSGNAQPVPRIQLLTPEFVSVPFTQDIVGFAGGLSHGWITGDRAVELPLLHEKWLYLQLQRERSFRARLGLIHHAQWGGEGNGTLPVSWENYWRVFFARTGGSDASESDQINSVGNSLGTWDANFTLFLDSWEITLYRHYFFEDSDGLDGFDSIEDGLSGIHLDFFDFPPIDTLVLETLWTRYQGGEYHDLGFLGRPDIVLGGRDSYYDHSAYQSGWTHQGNILGTSLFETSGEGESLRIASNRVIAWHAGVTGYITPQLRYRLLSTAAQHYPAYSRATLVTEAEVTKRQWYHYAGIVGQSAFGIDDASAGIGFAFDHGDLFGERYGVELFFEYALTP